MSRRFGRRTWFDRNRPRVLDVAPGLVHESGPMMDPAWAPERVAVMAHWSAVREPSRSVVAMLQAFDSAGYETVLVSAAEVAGPIGRVCAGGPGALVLPKATTVLRRANVGYDFGSWSAVLGALPGLRRADRVLLANDSAIGPLAPLEPALSHFNLCPTPVWGLVASRQHRPHLQSFCVGFRGGILDSPALRTFWSDVRVERGKAKVVRYYELGLSEALDEAGIGWQAMFLPRTGGPANPSLEDPARLLEQGMPVLKANARGVAELLSRRSGEQWVDRDREGGDRVDRRLSARERTRFLFDIEGPRGLIGGLGLRAAKCARPRTNVGMGSDVGQLPLLSTATDALEHTNDD